MGVLEVFATRNSLVGNCYLYIPIQTMILVKY
jgi:hypothetical protein